MSSEGIARVRALDRKAVELQGKGHSLRAADIYGRAVEAARNLVPGPDNLAALDMQLCQAATLHNYAVIAGGHGAALNTMVITFSSDEFAAYRAECIALFSEAVAALERRRVAGTLMECECSEALASRRVHSPAAEASCWANKLVGYELFLHAAKFVVYILLNAQLFAPECSAAQFETFAQHAVHATELMQQPHDRGTSVMPSEIEFVHMWLNTVDKLGHGGLNSRLVLKLTDAWQCLRRSGVLEARGLLNEHALLGVRTTIDKTANAARTAIMSPGLRSCALPGCGVKEAHPQHFKQCSACKTVVYCCSEHHLQHWPAHKAACKAARKAAKSGGGAGSTTAS